MAKRRSVVVPITPVPIPAGVKTVVVFGGSFDPPHFYHTLAPLALTNRLFGESGWLLYVPAAKSPLKAHGPIASDAQRVAMLKLALDIPGRRSIWTEELDRAKRKTGAPSFTIDTLRRLKKVLPRGVKLRLLIGSDQAADFHKWKDCRKIIEIAEPLVMARERVETVNQLYHALDSDFWTRPERAAWCRRMAPNFPMPASSTSVRDLIPGAPKRAAAWAEIEGLSSVITPVAAYIIKHRLYGFGTRRLKLTKRKKLDAADQIMVDMVGRDLKRAVTLADPKVHPRNAVTAINAPKEKRTSPKPVRRR